MKKLKIIGIIVAAIVFVLIVLAIGANAVSNFSVQNNSYDAVEDSGYAPNYAAKGEGH